MRAIEHLDAEGKTQASLLSFKPRQVLLLNSVPCTSSASTPAEVAIKAYNMGKLAMPEAYKLSPSQKFDLVCSVAQYLKRNGFSKTFKKFKSEARYEEGSPEDNVIDLELIFGNILMEREKSKNFGVNNIKVTAAELKRIESKKVNNNGLFEVENPSEEVEAIGTNIVTQLRKREENKERKCTLDDTKHVDQSRSSKEDDSVEKIEISDHKECEVMVNTELKGKKERKRKHEKFKSSTDEELDRHMINDAEKMELGCLPSANGNESKNDAKKKEKKKDRSKGCSNVVINTLAPSGVIEKEEDADVSRKNTNYDKKKERKMKDTLKCLSEGERNVPAVCALNHADQHITDQESTKLKKRKRECSNQDIDEDLKEPVEKIKKRNSWESVIPSDRDQSQDLGSRKEASEVENVEANGVVEQHGDKLLGANSVDLPRKASAEPTSAKRFQRVNADEIVFSNEKLKDNSYWAKDGAEIGYGAKAQEVLGQVRGKGFRHEKTKKKRGSYRGGQIDQQSHSVKFNFSDDD